MPEIWLPYGEVEVVLATGSENIGTVIEAQGGQGNKPEIKAKPYKNIITDGLRTSRAIAEKWIGNWDSASHLIDPADTITREVTVDGVTVRLPASLDGDTILVGAARVDPLYGFLGPHSLLTKELKLEHEVWKRKEGTFYAVREDNGVWFSRRILEYCNIDALFYFDANSQPFYGSASMVYSELLQYFKPHALPNRQSKFLILSAGGTPNDDNLSSALAVAYSAKDFLADDSDIIIVAQAKDGLGSPALKELVEGKKPKATPVQHYKDGIMSLIALLDLKSRARVSLVSSLSSVYAERLGIRLFSSLRDAYKEIHDSHRNRTRADIIKNASVYYSRSPVPEESGTGKI